MMRVLGSNCAGGLGCVHIQLLRLLLPFFTLLILWRVFHSIFLAMRFWQTNQCFGRLDQRSKNSLLPIHEPTQGRSKRDLRLYAYLGRKNLRQV